MRSCELAFRIFVSALLLGLAGCQAPGPSEDEGSSRGLAQKASVDAPHQRQADRDAARLALSEQRLYAPAGDNAVEAYLQLRETDDVADAAVATALLDLAPYVVIGIEQALAAGELAEADRLLVLLDRMDESAPALPRLALEVSAARDAIAAPVGLAEAAAPAVPVEPVVAAPVTPVAAPTVATPMPAPTVAAPPRPLRQPEQEAVLPQPVQERLPAQTRVATRPAAAARVPLSRPAARFPSDARRRGLEGTVELALTVTPEGRVIEAQVVSSSHAAFNREAVRSARRWRYTPAVDASTERAQMNFRVAD